MCCLRCRMGSSPSVGFQSRVPDALLLEQMEPNDEEAQLHQLRLGQGVPNYHNSQENGFQHLSIDRDEPMPLDYQ